MKNLPLNIICVDLSKYNHIGIEKLLSEFPFLSDIQYINPVTKAVIKNDQISSSVNNTSEKFDIRLAKNGNTSNPNFGKFEIDCPYDKLYIDKFNKILVGFTIRSKKSKGWEFMLYGPNPSRDISNKISQKTNVIIGDWTPSLFINLLNKLDSIDLPKKEFNIDNILDKISENGTESLTKKETNFIEATFTPKVDSTISNVEGSQNIICVDLTKFNQESISKLCEINDLESFSNHLIDMKEKGLAKVYINTVDNLIVGYTTKKNKGIYITEEFRDFLDKIVPIETTKPVINFNMDEILDKINDSGIESLSKKEVKYLESLKN